MLLNDVFSQCWKFISSAIGTKTSYSDILIFYLVTELYCFFFIVSLEMSFHCEYFSTSVRNRDTFKYPYYTATSCPGWLSLLIGSNCLLYRKPNEDGRQFHWIALNIHHVHVAIVLPCFRLDWDQLVTRFLFRSAVGEEVLHCIYRGKCHQHKKFAIKDFFFKIRIRSNKDHFLMNNLIFGPGTSGRTWSLLPPDLPARWGPRLAAACYCSAV